GVAGPREKAVHEIHVAARSDAPEEWTIRFGDLELIPTDLGHFLPAGRRETNDVPAEHPQARCATVELFALLEQRLVPDANAQEWPAGLDEVPRRGKHPLAVQGLYTIVERPNTGQAHRPCASHFVGSLNHLYGRPDLEQRLMHAAQVARAVIH